MLGRGRFNRLKAGGYVIPIRPGGKEYLRSFTEFRLAEDRRLGGGVVRKGHGRGSARKDQRTPARDATREEVLDRYDQPPEAVVSDEPGATMPQVLAALYSHAKSERDYLDQLEGVNPGMFGTYRLRIGERMEQLRALFEQEAPGDDLEKCCRKFEQDADGGGGTETGEAGLVDQGRIPPEEEGRGAARNLDNGKGRIPERGKGTASKQLGDEVRAEFRKTMDAFLRWKMRETMLLMHERGCGVSVERMRRAGIKV